MGVWIETRCPVPHRSKSPVTPCMGVWIETALKHLKVSSEKSHPVWVCGLKPLCPIWLSVHKVTPCMGVWIETLIGLIGLLPPLVTPCMGVWIETQGLVLLIKYVLSHPVWVCGLKLVTLWLMLLIIRHTLYGCVD